MYYSVDLKEDFEPIKNVYIRHYYLHNHLTNSIKHISVTLLGYKKPFISKCVKYIPYVNVKRLYSSEGSLNVEICKGDFSYINKEIEIYSSDILYHHEYSKQDLFKFSTIDYKRRLRLRESNRI